MNVPREFVPVWIDGARPRRRVTWMRFPHIDVPEPFFWQTLARLSESGCEELVTDGDALRRFAQLSPHVPLTFVFHVSHCGSTLLANALKAVSQAMVLAEPPLTRLEQALAPPIDAELLRGAINACAANGPPKRYLFVKFMNLASMFLPALRGIFPSAQFVFLYRDPQAVIGSKLAEVSEEARAACVPLMRRLMSKPERWNPSPSRFWSDVFEWQCTAAMSTPGTLCIDYDTLNPAAVFELLPKLGIAPEDVDREEVERCFSRYSKDPTGASIFTRSSDRASLHAARISREEYGFAHLAYARLAQSPLPN